MTLFEYIDGKSLLTTSGFKFTIYDVDCVTSTVSYVYSDGDQYRVSFSEFLKYHISSIQRSFPGLISLYPEYFI